MPSSREEDLDWLYGRDSGSRSGEPESTRVMPPVTERSGRAAPQPGRGRPQPPAAPSRPVARESSPREAAARAGGSPAAPWSSPRPGPAEPARPSGPAARQSYRPIPDPGGRPIRTTPPGPPAGVPQPSRRRRHPVRNLLVVVGVVVLACLVWLVGVPLYAYSQVPRVVNDPSGSRPANAPGYTFLLLGSDSRAGLTAEQRKKLGTGNAVGQRTDTIMILYVPPGGKPALISIPRDSYVAIPGNGHNKINAAYSFGGPKLITRTVEQNTGLRIDGYVEIGFGGFVNVIDALGGIRMCLANSVKDQDSHIDLKAGCQTLSGPNALGYVRQRHADPLGDLGRVQRQRQMVSAVMKKSLSPASVLNPVTYWDLNMAGAKSLTLGESTSAWEMLHFVLGMKAISANQGYTLTVPVADANYSTPAGDAVLWDRTRAQQMFSDISRGDTSQLKKFQR